MPRYLVQASYTAEGAKGLLKEGGSKRREAVEKMLKGLGGRLEACYFALGETDVFLIIDGVDNVGIVAASLAGSASGALHTKTTVLLTPEEMDQATKKAVTFRPPGR